MRQLLLLGILFSVANIGKGQPKFRVPEKNKPAFARLASISGDKTVVADGYKIKRKRRNRVALLNNNGGTSGTFRCECRKNSAGSCDITIEGSSLSCFGGCLCSFKVVVSGNRAAAVKRQTFKIVTQ